MNSRGMKPERLLFFISIALILTIVVFVVLQFFKKEDEGFGNFYNTQNAFTTEQRKTFRDKMNKSLPVNTGLANDMKQINKTLFSVDTMINTNYMAEQPPFSPEEDPMPAFRARNENECKPIRAPMYLKEHTKNPPTSCGWYYLDDDNKQSKATIGTEKGPLDPDFTINNPGGQWIWDNAKAQKLEDAKKCRKIKSCETADIYPDECGFCPSISQGVPIRKGKSKYPDDPNLMCDDRLVTNPSGCKPPKPAVKVIITKTGEMKRSGDIVDGEEIPFDPPPAALCDPNPSTGQLTNQCLISIAKAIGFSEYGILLKVLTGDLEGYYSKLGPNFDMMRIVRRIYETEASVKLRGEYFGDGPMSRAQILMGYRTIYNFVKNSPNRRVRNASNWLVTGKEFDLCDYDPDKVGPFEPLCMERVALEAGCQRDGYKFPGPDSWGKINLLKWSTFNTYFKDLYASLNNKDSKIQRQATLDCLGISVVSDAAILCGAPGAPCRVLSEADIARNPSVAAAQGNIENYKQQIPNAKTPIEKQLASELYNEAIQAKAQILTKIRKANKCPANPPIASFDFNLGRSDDRIQLYKSKKMGSINFTTMGGKKCAQFKGPGTYIDMVGPISTKSFKSVTMSIFINSTPGPWPRLWDFNNSSLGGSWCQDNVFGCLSPDIGMGVGMYAMKDCQGPSVWTGGGSIKKGQWHHIAWTMDTDFSGMTVYVDGQRKARWSDPNGKQWLKDKVFKNAYILQSPEQFDKDVGLGWFRIFDYTLSEEAINIDMKNSWTLPPLPPLPPEPPKAFDYLGCWGDGGNRALPKYTGQAKSPEECFNLAKANDASTFGLQYYGECWVGNNDNWNRYGKRDDAGCGPLGRDWVNQVYKIRPGPAVPLGKPLTYLPLLGDAKDIGAKPQTAKVSNANFTTVNGLRCAYFNNNMNAYITIPNLVQQNFTVAFWMLLKSGGYYTVVSRTINNFNGSEPKVQFDVAANSMPMTAYLALPNPWTQGVRQTDGKIQINVWYHVALTVMGKGGQMYINGVKQGGASGSAPMPNSDIWILGRSGDYGRAADVCLRQFAVWDYGLTGDNIKSIYTQTRDDNYLSIGDAPEAPAVVFKGPPACKDLGKPNHPNKTIRIYNEAECDSLGGNYYPNGECTKKEGGSFSWDCRVLN